jgi:hypothetical protein
MNRLEKYGDLRASPRKRAGTVAARAVLIRRFRLSPFAAAPRQTHVLLAGCYFRRRILSRLYYRRHDLGLLAFDISACVDLAPSPGSMFF